MAVRRRPRPVTAVLAAVLACVATGAAAGCTDDLGTAASRGEEASAAPTAGPGVVPPRRPDLGDSVPGRTGLVVETDDELVDRLAPCVKEFARRHRVTAVVQVGDSTRSALLQSLTNAEGPDVVTGSHSWIGVLAQRHAIVPVDLPRSLRRQLASVSRTAVRYAGHTWGVPLGMDTSALVRNVALAPKAPTSFAEVVATGRRLTSSGRTQAPLVQEVGLNGELRYAYPYLAASGGGIFARLPGGGYDGTRLQITSAGWLRGGERLAELARAGLLTTSIDARNSDALFDSGASAWFVTGPWSLARARSAGVTAKVSPLPRFADGAQPRPLVDVSTLMVSATSRHPHLARSLALRCGGSEQVQVALARTEHRPPARRDATRRAAKSEPDLAVWAEAARHGDPVPNVPQMDAVWGPLAQAEADIVSGDDPATALRQAADRIDAVNARRHAAAGSAQRSR